MNELCGLTDVWVYHLTTRRRQRHQYDHMTPKRIFLAPILRFRVIGNPVQFLLDGSMIGNANIWIEGCHEYAVLRKLHREKFPESWRSNEHCSFITKRNGKCRIHATMSRA